MPAFARHSRIWMPVGGVVVLAVIGGLFWRRPAPPAPALIEPMIPRGTAVRLLELRNLSLGHLENEDLAACDPLLQEIAERLPQDPFGPRNLTVARLLALQQSTAAPGSEAHQTSVRDAFATVELLRQVEGETAVLHVLRSRLELSAAGREPQAFAELQQAAALAPEEAWVAYELFQAGRYANDAATQAQAHEALQRAVALQPDNVWLVMELLPLEAERQAPELGAHLERLAELVRPFTATIAVQTRIDLLDYLHQARQAATDGDWELVRQRVRVVSNVLRPDPLAQADKLRVDRHALAFVLPNFGAAFFAEADLPEPQPAEAIPVAFVATPSELVPEVRHVRDLHLADFNLDGRPDVLLLGQDRIIVRGETETEVWTAAAALPSGLTGLLIADLDDDVDANAAAPLNQSAETSCRHADVDVIAWGAGGLAVLENRLDAATGARSIVAVPQNAEWQSVAGVRAAELVDLDHDGDLDLVIVADSGVMLWSNRGNLTFENISDRSALPSDVADVARLLAVDWDRDLDLDVLLVGGARLGVLENLRHGRLRYRELDAPAVAAGRGWELADVDNNQSWDLLSAGDDGLKLQRNHIGADGRIEPESPAILATEPFSDLVTLDYDNNGFLDLIAWNGARTTVFRGVGAGSFAEQPELSAQLPQQILAVAVGDVDDDGDLDLLIAGNSGVHVVSNMGGNENRWIKVAARAQQIKGNQASNSGRINHLGIGSTLVLRADGLDQTRLVRSEFTHFGLGRREQADVIRILWTNGVPQNVLQTPANGEICELQTLKGSCPYLYTWTGERFEFMTDLLWAAPLGLQFGEGILAPWRAWEYLRIPGDRLTEQDGRYRLQLTEELWEAAYFDEVRLIAVDHPAEIEVFTNEKVGPADIAEHTIHTVRRRRIPVAARDQRGRDVLPIVAAEDGHFLRAWDHKVRQGLTEPHCLELDLGELDQPARIMLYLTGWVYPSDTSINVGLSQNPDLESPRPPFLETPDENGIWREALPYMGFPGGKTKTIAVDVSHVFRGDDYRLRIGTTMEMCWDAAWFTVDEEPGEYRETDLPLLAADLHFRGISRREWRPNNQPELYHYDDVIPQSPWPPMDGAFTRYGDVTPLLTAWDDRLLIMAAGDECSLEFAAPVEPLPDGWVRDFVIYNVGWDKDADLNTVYGQSTEPLPFREMTDYALKNGEARTRDADYADYLRIYQTRHASRSRFWSELRGLPPEQ